MTAIYKTFIEILSTSYENCILFKVLKMDNIWNGYFPILSLIN